MKRIEARVVRKGLSAEKVEQELSSLAGRSTDLSISKLIRHRERYFSDGAAIGGKDFVDEVFRDCRERFGSKRVTGSRKPRGVLGVLAGQVWSARDLRVE